MMVGESTFNGVSSFTLFQAFLSVHHNYQGLISRIFWIIFETFISIMLGYSFGLVVSLFCKLGLKRHILMAPTHVEQIEGSNQGSDKEAKYSQGNAEIGMLILFPWISYLIAEALNLTGMITIFFCGVAIGQFALRNLRTPDRVVNAFKRASREGLCYNIRYQSVNIVHLYWYRIFGLRCRHLVMHN
jgi:NhaP-type Na+/H+ or K+/H+ antiporter